MPKPKPAVNIKSKVYVVFWSALIVFFLATLSYQTGKFKELGLKKAQLLLEIETQKKVNDELKKELELFHTDAHIEQIARRELGLLRPDEYIFVNDAKKYN